MNKDDALALLLELLDCIHCHPSLVNELCALLAQSGNERKFSRLITTRLIQLKEMGVEAVRLEEFEKSVMNSTACIAPGVTLTFVFCTPFCPRGSRFCCLPFTNEAANEKPITPLGLSLPSAGLQKKGRI